MLEKRTEDGSMEDGKESVIQPFHFAAIQSGGTGRENAREPIKFMVPTKAPGSPSTKSPTMSMHLRIYVDVKRR